VRAVNPDDEDVIDHIGSNRGPHWYAQAIARHESYQSGALVADRYYNEFNAPGTGGDYEPGPNNIVYTPNCHPDSGGTYGWGIMQLTNPAPTKNQMWNWQENVDRGVEIMTMHRNASSLDDGHPTTGLPPDVKCAGVTFTYEGTNGILKYHDLDTIKRYNSGKVFEWISKGERSHWEMLISNPVDSDDYTYKVIQGN
jgi:hypothetical protein